MGSQTMRSNIFYGNVGPPEKIHLLLYFIKETPDIETPYLPPGPRALEDWGCGSHSVCCVHLMPKGPVINGPGRAQ